MRAEAQRRLIDSYAPVVRELHRNFGARLKTVVLFGSRARDEAKMESDHDIFVVVEGLPGEPVARQRLLRLSLLPILDTLPGAVSLIGRTPEEFSAALTPLVLDVCTDGICLWGREFFEPYRRKAMSAVHDAQLERKQWGQDRVWVFRQQPVGNWELSWEGFREGV